MLGGCGQDVGRSLEAEARIQEQAALQPEQDQGVGQLEEPEDQAIDAKDQLVTPEPEPCPVLGHLQSLGTDEGATPRTAFTSTCPRLPAAEAPISLRPSTRRTKVGRSLKAKAGTQEQAALQQEQDQGVGQLEGPETPATPLGNQERRLNEFPASGIAQDLLTQDLLSQAGAGMIGEGNQDVWGNLVKFFRKSSRLQATAAGLLLQKKHVTFTEYGTIEAKDQMATTEPEPCTVLVHLRSLGPDGGATPRTPFMSTCPRLPAGEALTSRGPSTMRKDSDPQPYPPSPRDTTDAKLSVYLMLSLDGPDPDIETEAGRSCSFSS